MSKRMIFESGGIPKTDVPVKTFYLANATITLSGEAVLFIGFWDRHIRQLERTYFTEWAKFFDMQKQIMRGAAITTFAEWEKMIWPISNYNPKN